VAASAKPDTILGWYRKLIAHKFDGSKRRQSQGRPRIDEETENLVVRMAKENPSWGYDRIVGAMANLGYKLSDQTVGNILGRHEVAPAPKRKHTTSWKDFIRTHLDVLAGTDFFTVEVFTLKGLVAYYVLFFIHLESRKVCLAGMTPHPDEEWMKQIGRNVTLDQWGFLGNCRYLLHDRDGKFCPAFDQIIELGNVTPIRSPNLNAFSERWVKSVKEECLEKVILFGESSLRRALYKLTTFIIMKKEIIKGNRLLFPSQARLVGRDEESVQCQERLGGLLKYYYRQAA
jgi:putative transposase